MVTGGLLDPYAFRSHRCGRADFYLFHVYDNLSQTPYNPDYGIVCGDPIPPYMRPRYIITYESMLAHTYWQNRDPTYFISFYGSFDLAMREARRRQRVQWVWNQSTGTYFERDLSSVRIAVVSAKQLDRHNVFYFSGSELGQMLQLSFDDDLSRRIGAHEWFAMGSIPDDAITQDFQP